MFFASTTRQRTAALRGAGDAIREPRKSIGAPFGERLGICTIRLTSGMHALVRCTTLKT